MVLVPRDHIEVPRTFWRIHQPPAVAFGFSHRTTFAVALIRVGELHALLHRHPATIAASEIAAMGIISCPTLSANPGRHQCHGKPTDVASRTSAACVRSSPHDKHHAIVHILPELTPTHQRADFESSTHA